MVKKISFQSIFLSFLFFREAFAAESTGMPQLNPEFWISQIFWLTGTFTLLYVVLSKLILPKISANLEMRKSQILENIDTAERHREEVEIKTKEYEEIIKNTKIEAQNYFNQTREKILKNINKKKDILDYDLNQEIKKAETEIQSLMDKAPEKVNKIAIETSGDLINHLLGINVNNSSISAIVEDLSIKNKDKYYGH